MPVEPARNAVTCRPTRSELPADEPAMRRAWTWIALSVVLLGGGVWVWNSDPIHLKDRIFPRKFAVVEPRLLRAGQIDKGLIEDVLREHKVDVIVDLVGGKPDEDRAAEQQAAAKLGVRDENFPMPGSGMGDVQSYARAVACIHHSLQDGQTVLVHCAAGSRRTGGVLAAYELLNRGDRSKAQLELDRCEGVDDPARLRNYLNANLPQIAAELQQMGVPVVPQEPPRVDGG
jgi:protein tyrosine/serine phosphatase